MPSKPVADLWFSVFGISSFYSSIAFYGIYPETIVFNQLYYIVSFLFSLTAVLTVGRGKTLLENLGLIISFGIPRKRKSWGTIYNSETNEPLPFASIRLIQNDENGHFVKVINEIVSDVEGRYRVYDLPNETNVSMQVKLSGFEIFEKKLVDLKERTSNNDLTEDIRLTPSGELDNQDIQRRQNFVKGITKIIIPIIYAISLFSVITIPFYFLTSKFDFGFVIYYNLAVAVVTLIWNTIVIFNFGRKSEGKLLDSYKKSPIGFASIKIYQENKPILSKVTDNSGKLIFPVKPGKYTLDIFREGYFPISNYNIVVNNEGYVNKDIFLQKEGGRLILRNPSKLRNPFAQ